MKNSNRSSRFMRVAGTLFLASALVLAGCDTDEILDVVDPDTVNPGTLEDEALLDIVVAGAIGEFTSGYSGSGGDAFLSVSAVMGDEFFSSGTFTTRTASDRRLQFPASQGNTSDGAYTNLHQARRALSQAAIKVAKFKSNTDATYARLKALEGYSILTLAEGWCGAVPLSDVDDTGAFVYGAALETNGLLDAAIQRFDEAITAGGAYADLARVGKGRALLGKASYAAAASAVSSVATGYVYHINHSVNGANNPIFSLQGNGRYSVSDLEGGAQTGLDFRSAMDPRVQWYQDPDGGFDPSIPLYMSKKYAGFTSPVAMATGVEARLIEAEAALNANDLTGMTTALNALRANVVNLMKGIQPDYAVGANDVVLADLPVPADAPTARQVLFRERGFWLFLTGHRLGDMRRLVRNYALAQTAVFPTAEYHKGGDYGTDVSFQMDFDETNNPDYDLTKCDVTKA